MDESKLLAISDDAEFIREAYRAVLRREVDAGGFANYSALLRGGTPRAEVLRQLAQSSEARAAGDRTAPAAPAASSSVRRGKQSILERLRRIHAFILTAFRIPRIELKLEYLSAELNALSERQAAKLTALAEQQSAAVVALAEQQSVALAKAAADAETLRIEIGRLEHLVQNLADTRHPAVIPAGHHVVATEVDGFIIGIPGDEWRLAAYYALRGVPEPGMVKVFREMVKPGMVVVDVGAHIGLYSLYALRGLQGHGKVFSFEPSPRTMALLKDNIQVNGFLESNVARLFPFAVSRESGEGELSIVDTNSGHNTLFGTGLLAERVPVRTVSLDEILADEPRIDMVKIDAEGAEPFIFQGMSRLRQNNPQLRIFIEFAPEHLLRAGVDPLEWASLILSSGYMVRRLEDVTGELILVSASELASCISWNLLLSPAPAPEFVN